MGKSSSLQTARWSGPTSTTPRCSKPAPPAASNSKRSRITNSKPSPPSKSDRSRRAGRARFASPTSTRRTAIAFSGGEGEVAGFAKGGAKVSLTDQDGGTLLTYDVEAQIGGKLAQLGQRLINSAAKKTADDFFVKFAAAVTQPR